MISNSGCFRHRAVLKLSEPSALVQTRLLSRAVPSRARRGQPTPEVCGQECFTLTQDLPLTKICGFIKRRCGIAQEEADTDL